MENKQYYYSQIAQNLHYAAIFKRKSGVFYCEHKKDSRFWAKILKEYAPDLTFEPQWVTNTAVGNTDASGKGQVLNFLHCANPNFLLFIDSDYDFLLENERLNSDFLVHTFTYSIENHWCYASNITTFLEQKYNVRIDFDFELFLNRFSNIIYDAFIYTVLNRSKQTNCFSIYELEKLLTFHNFSIENNANAYLLHIDNVLEGEVAKLKALFSQNEFDNLESYLQSQKGLTAETTYLYLRGHTLYEKVLEHILEKVKANVSKEKFAVLPAQERENFSKTIAKFTNLASNLSFSGYFQMENIFKLMAQKGFRKV